MLVRTKLLYSGTERNCENLLQHYGTVNEKNLLKSIKCFSVDVFGELIEKQKVDDRHFVNGALKLTGAFYFSEWLLCCRVVENEHIIFILK